MPAAFIASIFPSAVPSPPLMIAPACPIRFPGGAVRPAIKPATGFLIFAFTKSAAISSSVPPISPIIIIPWVSSSSSNMESSSMKFKPLTGSPPIPTHVVCEMPRELHCQTAS